jgi:NADP-dependent 3-hydroxy acid dehydrogenase YdfG
MSLALENWRTVARPAQKLIQQARIMTDPDRVWLITGSSTGFGLALAQALLERGDRVTTVALDVTDVRSLQQAIENALHAYSLFSQ